jgi:acyl-lipid omega-6 desaturase (Delta-12 desaturase)
VCCAPALWGKTLQKYLAAQAEPHVEPHVESMSADNDDPCDGFATFSEFQKNEVRRWARHCARFRAPDNKRAFMQIVNTVLPLLALTVLSFWSSKYSVLLPLLIAIPAGGLLVRMFIIQHDCGHGSFLGSTQLNTVVGRIMSVFTLAPYSLWRREHAIHHNGSGNLEKRGVGDIDTKTVAEYLASSPLERLRYRLYRHPLFLFGLGVPAYFLLIQRLPWFHGLKAAESWRSVMSLNAAIVAVYGTLGYLLGFGAVALVCLPMLHVAAALGGWLFFVQHQFEETHWESAETWDFQIAAVHGSSYYVLPKPLQWVTGNIGLHHIHHLNSMVPNYRLQECLDALPELGQVNRLTLWESFRCVRLALWDDTARRLVSYREAMQRAQPAE